MSTIILAAIGCAPPVMIPSSPGQDAPPIVNIGYVRQNVGNAAPGDFLSTTHGGPLNIPTADVNHDFLVTASATNPKGGVKEITLEIGQSGHALQTIKNAQVPDANGNVLPSLSITGTNGAGGVGSNAILARAGNNPSFYATATATNFNGQTSTLNVIFTVVAGPPSIFDFSATPNGGYINVGETATLHWNVACGVGTGGCNVALRGKDGVGFADLVLFVPALGFAGSMAVTPTRSTLTKYTLTVTNADEVKLATSQSVTVQLYLAPPTGLTPFWFKMTGTSQVTPCFTLMQPAKDQASAKQLAELHNGGYSAFAITEQQFLDGC